MFLEKNKKCFGKVVSVTLPIELTVSVLVYSMKRRENKK